MSGEPIHGGSGRWQCLAPAVHKSVSFLGGVVVVDFDTCATTAVVTALSAVRAAPRGSRSGWQNEPNHGVGPVSQNEPNHGLVGRLAERTIHAGRRGRRIAAPLNTAPDRGA